VQNYFMPGNLTALRELALRRTAQRVDDQMVTYMRAHAIPGPWAAAQVECASLEKIVSGRDPRVLDVSQPRASRLRR
jgi:two-component system sensor histidine kinase KdpD